MLTNINPLDSYSLYLHIPLCTRRCSYCAFYSEVASTVESDRATFSKRIVEELQSVVEILKTPFATVFLGGGNPGLLPLEDLITILDLVRENGIVEETTIEMNPESLRMDHEILFEHGLDRLSIGIQSMSSKHLKTLGRNSNISMNIKSASTIQKMRTKNTFRLNCDLMTCIPGQTIEDAINDIDTVIELFNPDHISLYNLTVEEGTPLAKKIGDGSLYVKGEDEQAELLQACWSHLAKRGFEHYEISNFSRDRATRSHHNERYWQLKNYIGIGPAAAGTLFTDKNKVVRTAGEPNFHTYCNNPPFTSYTFEVLDESDLMLEMLLVGLRTVDGIDKEEWNKRFSTEFLPLFSHELTDIYAMNPGLCIDSPEKFSLSEEGFMVLDAIVLQLASAIQKTLNRAPT